MCHYNPWKQGASNDRADGTERQRNTMHAERQETAEASDAAGDASAESAALGRDQDLEPIQAMTSLPAKRKRRMTARERPKMLLHDDGNSFLCDRCWATIPRTRSCPFPEHICATRNLKRKP